MSRLHRLGGMPTGRPSWVWDVRLKVILEVGQADLDLLQTPVRVGDLVEAVVVAKLGITDRTVDQGQDVIDVLMELMAKVPDLADGLRVEDVLAGGRLLSGVGLLRHDDPDDLGGVRTTRG